MVRTNTTALTLLPPLGSCSVVVRHGPRAPTCLLSHFFDVVYNGFLTKLNYVGGGGEACEGIRGTFGIKVKPLHVPFVKKSRASISVFGAHTQAMIGREFASCSPV